MEIEMARRNLPIYAAQHIDDEFAFDPEERKPRKSLAHRIRFFDVDEFKRRYGIVLIGAVLFTLYTIVLSACVNAAAVKQTKAEMLEWHNAQMEAYQAELAYQEQAKSFLSGTDSLNVAVNQAVDAVAPVIARLNTDEQKLTETCCMLARVMNPYYPGSFQEVAEQPSQWMFYDGTNKTCTEHDRELAESIIRPYMENGTIPNGLTDLMVYGEWSTNDFVLRDSYKTTSTMRTFRYTA